MGVVQRVNGADEMRSLRCGRRHSPAPAWRLRARRAKPGLKDWPGAALGHPHSTSSTSSSSGSEKPEEEVPTEQLACLGRCPVAQGEVDFPGGG